MPEWMMLAVPVLTLAAGVLIGWGAQREKVRAVEERLQRGDARFDVAEAARVAAAREDGGFEARLAVVEKATTEVGDIGRALARFEGATDATLKAIAKEIEHHGREITGIHRVLADMAKEKLGFRAPEPPVDPALERRRARG